jgi:hypothetical protein
MKSREEVLTLFRAKYDYLKSVYPEVGSFEEIRLYQNPDGGWQMNLENCAAITLRPGDEEPHETHGPICAQWYQQGRAFDDAGIPGWLGYPISDVRDEMQIESPPVVLCVPDSPNPLRIRVHGAVSEFEYGSVCWSCGLTWERVYEEDTEGQMFIRGEGPFAVCPGTSCFLNTNGSNHLPRDIDKAIFAIMHKHGFHSVKTEKTCHLSGEACGGPVWTFQMTAKNGEEFKVDLWHDSSHAVRGRYVHTPGPPKSWMETIFPRRETNGRIYISASELALGEFIVEQSEMP